MLSVLRRYRKEVLASKKPRRGSDGLFVCNRAVFAAFLLPYIGKRISRYTVEMATVMIISGMPTFRNPMNVMG